MHNRSQIGALGVLLLFTQNTGVQLILCSRILNLLQNWILRKPVFLWVPVALAKSSYTLLAWVIRVKFVLCSLLCIQIVWRMVHHQNLKKNQFSLRYVVRKVQLRANLQLQLLQLRTNLQLHLILSKSGSSGLSTILNTKSTINFVKSNHP